MNTEKTLYLVIGTIVLTIIGFLIIPPFMKKYSNRIYKSSLKKDRIDIDNMEPEIVKKNIPAEEQAHGY